MATATKELIPESDQRFLVACLEDGDYKSIQQWGENHGFVYTRLAERTPEMARSVELRKPGNTNKACDNFICSMPADAGVLIYF